MQRPGFLAIVQDLQMVNKHMFPTETSWGLMPGWVYLPSVLSPRLASAPLSWGPELIKLIKPNMFGPKQRPLSITNLNNLQHSDMTEEWWKPESQ